MYDLKINIWSMPSDFDDDIHFDYTILYDIHMPNKLTSKSKNVRPQQMPRITSANKTSFIISEIDPWNLGSCIRYSSMTQSEPLHWQ